MSDEERKALIAEILNVPTLEHSDRLARINAPLVLAQGGPLYMPSGYRNPALAEGWNIVRLYLLDLARDHGVDISQPID